jgi:glycosyltransferase involved in cell wall biosynthesis
VNFKIIVAAYKCPNLIEACLKSIVNQDYENYNVCIVDDDSEAGEQWDIISRYSKEYGWASARMTDRMGAMHNQTFAIKKICKDPEDVIVFLDGDDKFSNSEVLSYINTIYEANNKVELTYGSYRPVPTSSTCPTPRAYPRDVILNRSYRKFASNGGGIYFNHLRTFKYKLFLQMNPEIDFKDQNGNWFMTCTDTAMMMPALELADQHVFVDKILYDYTSNNPISDWRVSSRLIDSNHDYILNRLTPKVRNVK